MAKNEKNEVAIQETNPVCAYNYGKYAGAGNEETDRDDFKIPFVYLINYGNPELKEGDPKYVKEAKAGMFINSVTRQLYAPGDLFVVPCHTRQRFVEWVPRRQGGGYVTEYEKSNPIVQEAIAANDGKINKDLKNPKNGNDLVQTFTVYALRMHGVDDTEPGEMIVIPCTSSKVSRYKEIRTRLGTVKGAADRPLFANRLVLSSTSELDKKSGERYMNVKFSPAISDDVGASLMDPAKFGAVIEAAAAFQSAVKGGLAQADYSSVGRDASGDPEGDDVF